MLARDAVGAWIVVERALGTGTSPRRIHLDLIGPAVPEIGERWARGEVSVGEQHTATPVASRLVGRLGPHLTRRGPTRGTVVPAGAPGERHTLCTIMLADLLRADDWGIVELGGDTPAKDLVAAVRQADRLAAVAITAASDDAGPAAADAAAGVRAAGIRTPMLIGGPGVTSRAAAATVVRSAPPSRGGSE